MADHLRAIAFSIADGQLLERQGGYVIRRILRRAVRYGYTYLGFTEPTLCKLVAGLVEQMGGQFPELKAQQTLIEKVIEEEEASFLRTLATGINLLDGVIATKSEGKGADFGKEAFVLYDTFGFPIDLTELIAREQGVGVDLGVVREGAAGPEGAFAQRRRRGYGRLGGALPINESVFTGYDTLTERVKHRALPPRDLQRQDLLPAGFDRTPFYGNSGGQIGDTGYIENANERIAVVATEKENGLIIHIVEELPGETLRPISWPSWTLRNGSPRPTTIRRHTSCTRRCVRCWDARRAKGFDGDARDLRFDFSHFQKVTPAELREVEMLVNRAVRANYPLRRTARPPRTRPRKCGAMMLFGEKYGDKVRMVRFGRSVELCGGYALPALRVTSGSSRF